MCSRVPTAGVSESVGTVSSVPHYNQHISRQGGSGCAGQMERSGGCALSLPLPLSLSLSRGRDVNATLGATGTMSRLWALLLPRMAALRGPRENWKGVCRSTGRCEWERPRGNSHLLSARGAALQGNIRCPSSPLSVRCRPSCPRPCPSVLPQLSLRSRISL